MRDSKVRIGVVAPGRRLEMHVADRVNAIAADAYSDRLSEIHFHPQCFLSSGHFAGDDDARARAFVDVANDETFDALWFARGGHGACRLVAGVLPRLTEVARRKLYLGYSDAGFLLGGLYAAGFRRLAHGPMPVDICRAGGEDAVKRALDYLTGRVSGVLAAGVSPHVRTAAFNMTVLSHLLGTTWQPDLGGHVLMLEEEAEYMYAIDRRLFQITGNAGIRAAAGIMLGRCSNIPPNDPDFGQTEEDLTIQWCERAGISYLGRADIGHDIHNKIVPFGLAPLDGS